MQKPDKEIQPNDFGSSSSNIIATRLSQVMAAAMPPNPAISAMSCRLSSGIIAAVARRHCRGDGRAHAFGAGTGREVVKVLIGIDPHRI